MVDIKRVEMIDIRELIMQIIYAPTNTKYMGEERDKDIMKAVVQTNLGEEYYKFNPNKIKGTENIKNSDKYKDMLKKDIKRVNKKEKSEEFIKTARKNGEKLRSFTEDQLKQIMKDKTNNTLSSLECGKKYIGRNGKVISQDTVRKIWNGKLLPLDGVNEDYQSLIEFKRKRVF